jgi:hypothetical protein
MKHIKLFEDNELPSHFQIKDLVVVDFGEAGKLTNCRIHEVHFDEAKVYYDVEVMVNAVEKNVTIIKDIDSALVGKIQEE